LGPFRGPTGLTPTFEFPFSRYIHSTFSRRFYLISFTVLLRQSRRLDFLPSLVTVLYSVFKFSIYMYILYINIMYPKKYFFNFIEKKFKKFFRPFSGPPGLTPNIFEFPFSRYIPSNFSRRFYLISFTVLLRHSDVSTSFHPSFYTVLYLVFDFSIYNYIHILYIAGKNNFFIFEFNCLKFFSNFFWALSRGPEAHRLTQALRRFDFLSSLLLHGNPLGL